MKVKELISLLKQCDKDNDVTVWHPFTDDEDFDVKVSVTGTIAETNVHVGVYVLGREIPLGTPARRRAGE